MDLKSKIILIYGPTASGKSKFSVQLAKKIKRDIEQKKTGLIKPNTDIIT